MDWSRGGLAPVIRALTALGHDQRVAHTGQHYDERMSEVFFVQLGLPRPDVNLEVGSGSHARQTAEVLTGMEAEFTENSPALVAELEACPARSAAETLPVLREIFTVQATPARLAALAKLAGLGDDVIAGRRIGVLSRAADAATAAALSAGLAGQRLLPSELVVLAEAPDAASAELSARAVTATLTGLADRGVNVRAVPVVTGEPSSWLRRTATAARSPWVVPWQAQREYRDTYLLDLACARECAQADAAGYGGSGFAFTAALDPALARREYFAAADPGHGLRLFSVS
jgi:hypothetical protein